MNEARNVPSRKTIMFALVYCFVIAVRFLQYLYTIEVRSAMTIGLYTVLFIAGIFLFRQHLADSWQLLKQSIFRSLLLLIGSYILIRFFPNVIFMIKYGDLMSMET